MAAAAGDVSDTISRRFVFPNVFTAEEGFTEEREIEPDLSEFAFISCAILPFIQDHLFDIRE